MDLLIGIVSGIVVMIIGSFWPGTRWICEWFVDRAVVQLPEPYQDEMREEWIAELEVGPGGIWSLRWAIDLWRGSYVIAGTFEVIDEADEEYPQVVEIEVEEGTEVKVRVRGKDEE